MNLSQTSRSRSATFVVFRDRIPKRRTWLWLWKMQSSIAQDRGLKLSIYAGAGIPQYWIVNLPERIIEVYTQVDPAGLRYQQRRDFRVGESLPVVLRNAVIAELDIADLLP